MAIINSEKNLFKNWTQSIYALIKDEKKMLSSEILFLTCSGFDIINNTNSSLSSQDTLEKIFNFSKKYRITDLVFESSLYLISSLKIFKEIYIGSLLESSILLKKKLSDYVIYLIISNRKNFDLSISYKLIDYYIEFDLFQEYKELIISLRLENPKLIGPLSRPYSDSYNYFEMDHSLSTLYFSSNNKEEFSRIKSSYNIKNYFQKAVENEYISQTDLKQIFNTIYEEKFWGENPESKELLYSGKGTYSEVVNNVFFETIKNFKENYKIKEILDYGCGDFHVGKTLIKIFKKYIGVDISDKVINYNKLENRYDNVTFLTLDEYLTNNRFNSELILFRQVLQHLPNFYIKNLLKWVSNKFRYCITLETLPKNSLNSNLEGKSFINSRYITNSVIRINEEPFNINASVLEKYTPFDKNENVYYEITYYSFDSE